MRGRPYNTRHGIAYECVHVLTAESGRGEPPRQTRVDATKEAEVSTGEQPSSRSVDQNRMEVAATGRDEARRVRYGWVDSHLRLAATIVRAVMAPRGTDRAYRDCHRNGERQYEQPRQKCHRSPC
jgi:hypothetical protein